MKKAFELVLDGRPFRVQFDAPADYSVRGVCILVQSGQMGRLDEEGAEGELQLYDQLSEHLRHIGVGVVRFDMELRENLTEPASESHLNERIDRLRLVCQSPELEGQPVFLCGMSLGAQCVWELITSSDDRFHAQGALLIGCPIEQPRVVDHRVRAIHLVFGAEDYIAYIEDDNMDNIVPISPTEYATWSLENLLVNPEQHKSVHILPGVGHTLSPETGGDNTVDRKSELFLLQLIQDLL